MHASLYGVGARPPARPETQWVRDRAPKAENIWQIELNSYFSGIHVAHDSYVRILDCYFVILLLDINAGKNGWQSFKVEKACHYG